MRRCTYSRRRTHIGWIKVGHQNLGLDERFLPIIRQLVRVVTAAKEANVAVINGEIAQMVGAGVGLWRLPDPLGCGMRLVVEKKDKLLTGTEMKSGDTIVMLREEGFRCNGLSLARKALKEKHGDEWHNVSFGDSLWENSSSRHHAFIRDSLWGSTEDSTPKARAGSTGAHITGGGVPEKMVRVLRRSRLGARLNNVFEPGEIVQYVQKTGIFLTMMRIAHGTWGKVWRL